VVGRVDLKSLKSREGRAWGRTMEFFFFFLRGARHKATAYYWFCHYQFKI
jgi:hypothetical protein